AFIYPQDPSKRSIFRTFSVLIQRGIIHVRRFLVLLISIQLTSTHPKKSMKTLFQCFFVRSGLPLSSSSKKLWFKSGYGFMVRDFSFLFLMKYNGARSFNSLMISEVP